MLGRTLFFSEKLEGLRSPIYLSLPCTCTQKILCSFYIIAKILFAYATFASFLLQFYVPMDFLEPAILEQMKLNTEAHKSIKVVVQIFFRSVTVLFIGECLEWCTIPSHTQAITPPPVRLGTSLPFSADLS